MHPRSPTRFGMLDTELARATRHSIAVVATPALIVLDDLDLRLGMGYTATGVTAPGERPTCRWTANMRYLFPFSHTAAWAMFGVSGPPDDGTNVRPWSPDRRRIRGALGRASEQDFATMRKLVGTAALFLMSAQSRLIDSIELAAAVHRHRDRPRPFALAPSSARDEVNSVVWRSTHALMEHAEEHRWADFLMRPPVHDLEGMRQTPLR